MESGKNTWLDEKYAVEQQQLSLSRCHLHLLLFQSHASFDYQSYQQSSNGVHQRSGALQRLVQYGVRVEWPISSHHKSYFALSRTFHHPQALYLLVYEAASILHKDLRLVHLKHLHDQDHNTH